MYNLRELSEPAGTVVTLDRCKRRLRVLEREEDSDILEHLKEATTRIRDEIERSLLPQQWRLSMDCWPCTIRVPMPPLRTVDEITYVDEDGVRQTLDPLLYRVDSEATPGRITPAHEQTWPAIRSENSAIQVDFTAGYDKVPYPIVTAILLTLANIFEHRETIIVGSISSEIPKAADYYLAPYIANHL